MNLRHVLHRYNLPNPMTLLDNPVSKLKWKRQIKDAVFLYWKDRINKDCQLYCSLRYLNTEIYQPGQIHHLIKINGNPVRETARLAIKLKLVTDTYLFFRQRVPVLGIEKAAHSVYYVKMQTKLLNTSY